MLNEKTIKKFMKHTSNRGVLLVNEAERCISNGHFILYNVPNECFAAIPANIKEDLSSNAIHSLKKSCEDATYKMNLTSRLEVSNTNNTIRKGDLTRILETENRDENAFILGISQDYLELLDILNFDKILASAPNRMVIFRSNGQIVAGLMPKRI